MMMADTQRRNERTVPTRGEGGGGVHFVLERRTGKI